MTDPKQDVRQQFEAWARPQGFRLHVRDMPGAVRFGQYCDDTAQAAFDAYQAALQSPAVRGLVEAAKVYVGPMDDPGIGWCGSSSSHPGLFKCERCGQEHTDCSLIPHRPDCSAARLLAALRTLGAGHVG